MYGKFVALTFIQPNMLLALGSTGIFLLLVVKALKLILCT